MRRYKKYIGTAIFLYWLIFAYVWGYWGWNDSVLFSRWWLFDTIGHGLFGVGGTITLLFYFRNSMDSWFFFSGRKFIMIATVSGVALTGVVWEFFEALWDVYHNGVPDHVLAQNSALDNMVDVLAETFASFLTISLYNLYNTWYWKKHPNSYIETMAFCVEALSLHIDREMIAQKKQVRTALRRRLKQRLKKTFSSHHHK